MQPIEQIVTVTLNPAVDRVLEVPDFAVGQHLQGREVARAPAGKGINVSRALASLGRGSIATGFVGAAEFDPFERYLRESGPGRVTCQFLSVHGATRHNVTILDPHNKTDTHIRDEGFEILEPDHKRVLSKVGLLSRPTAIIIFSGSLPRGMDADELNLLISVALDGGARVVLDIDGPLLASLIRPDQEAPSGVWLTVPNLDELAKWTGAEPLDTDEQVIAAANPLAGRIGSLVVSMGDRGALMLKQGKLWRARLNVDQSGVVSTVGSGDCLLAGLLDASARAQPPEGMLRRGLAAATANAMTPNVADFDPRQVSEFELKVEVETSEI